MCFANMALVKYQHAHKKRMDRLLFCQEIWSVWCRLLQFRRLDAFCSVTLHISHVTDIFHYDAQWNVTSVTIFIVMQFKLCVVWRCTCCLKKSSQFHNCPTADCRQQAKYWFSSLSRLQVRKLRITFVSIFCQCDDSGVRVLHFIHNCLSF